MKKFILGLAVVSLIGWGVTRGIMNIQFERKCEGYLKRAADANNIPLAIEQLDKALKYIEANELTQGSTHIFYSSPDLDMGFWYGNIKGAHDNLKKLETDKLTSLEESNTLIKLRETLLDHTSSGDKVTIPKGISVYPFNLLFALWGFLSALVAIIMVIWLKVADEWDD